MRRITTKISFVLAVVTMVVGIAWATSVHLKNNRNPNFIDNTGPAPSGDLTLTTTGALAGLGNGDVVIAVEAKANPTGQCCNPSGECKVPGHNPAAVKLTGTEAIPGADIKNDNLSFTVSTAPPVTPIPGAPDCPNTSWAENITDLVFTRATVTVYQPAILACVNGANNGTLCTSSTECTGGGSCAPVNPSNTTQTAQAVFATTCTLSGVDGTLASSCP